MRGSRHRREVLSRVVDRRLTQAKAAEILSLGSRRVRRLVKALEAKGPAGLASKKRGRPSNRLLDEEFRARVLEQVSARYSDFGPTLAAEKLAELDGLHVSKETPRRWMVAGRVIEVSFLTALNDQAISGTRFSVIRLTLRPESHLVVSQG